jgi:hypothetical protein
MPVNTTCARRMARLSNSALLMPVDDAYISGIETEGTLK